ncbi:MAG TPA: MXAN_5808 family serine peptidase [Kofleriaceae bacterium]|jgi:carboxyl-terminal processing protease|nr:MXAN_5808 family serine peptidase [Kofleriaceae bacterium]
MRSRLNLALVVAAGALALVLTVIRQSPEGVVSLELNTQEVRAAPGEAQLARHDLSALKIFNMTLLRIKERYVDPARVDPKKMLYAALDSVQFNIPEVLVEPDPTHNKVRVTVNDKPETFETADVDSPWRLAGKLKKVFQFIETNMNAGADLAKVEYAAVNGMLSTLDPHSILMDPEQARDMDVSTSGKFGGLGIVIRMIERKLTVVKPMKDTPAWRKGIKAGDHIVRINQEPTENLTSNEAVDRMRGDPKTAVTLFVERKGADGLLRFDLIRDVIRVQQVEHKLLDKGVGYIKVMQFSKGIASDVAEAMREMSAKGASSWILDLRGNPGGLLDEAVQLSDLFVDSGTLVTTVSGRDREARRAERGFGDTTSSLAVLVSGGSASASEIVAGALKNLDRAAIIGTRTFGKGSVQELYDNEDHSKLKLTIAQYLTPGDRSIQNLGIVPDIQLQRLYIPDKNDSPQDFVRMLAPTRTFGEKDLDAHLVSTYAKDIDKPAFEVPYLVDRKKPASGAVAEVKRSDDDDDSPDNDEIVEDFEMRFAKQLVSSAPAQARPKLVAGAGKLVQSVRADEEKKLVTALQAIGVDWSAAPASPAGKPSLDVSIAASPSGHVKAGDIVTVTATVKNTGSEPAYRVLSRIQGDDPVFEDTELPIGKVAPGETKTYAAKLQIPKDALDRVDRLGMEIREAHNAPAHVTPTELNIEAAPRPVFAYAWQLVDDGNGDGLVQRGEHYRLEVQIKNTGTGPTQEATVLLRNATGDGVVLDKSRAEFKEALAPGQIKEIEFPLATDATLKGDEMVVELMAYDSALDVQASDKLHFKLSPQVPAQPRSGDITVKTQTTIRSGASDDTSIVGYAAKGASYPAIASFGPWTKVKLNAGGTKIGFLPTAAVVAGGSGQGQFTQVWNSTPPMIALNMKGLETSADTYKLSGNISAEQHVEDVYIFVSNQSSKIESRKVFYRSNRSGKDGKLLEFAADLPLWPGSNMVTVVGRTSAEVRSVKTMFVYRDPPRTAQAP